MLYSQSSSVETSSVGDRVVLYDNLSRKAVVLNPTGALLWKQLKTPHSTDQLAQSLQIQFPQVEAAQLQADVENCLRELLQQQLLLQES